MFARRRSKQLLFVALSLFTLQVSANPLLCPEMAKKLRLMGKASPEASFLELNPAESKPVRLFKPEDYKALAPNFKGKAFNGKDVSFRVASPVEALQTMEKFSERGFWLMFNPSNINDRARFGHTTIVIKGDWFNRLGDGMGEAAMQSKPIREVIAAMAQMDTTPFVTMQYFELSAPSTNILSKFFHDRVYLYHKDRANNVQNSPYLTSYSELPFTRDRPKEANDMGKVENCAVFSMSFGLPLWTATRPELRQVLSEIGKFSGAQLPNQQIALNQDSPSYRGAVFMAKNPEKVSEGLKKDGLQSDPAGESLAFTAPFEEIKAQ